MTKVVMTLMEGNRSCCQYQESAGNISIHYGHSQMYHKLQKLPHDQLRAFCLENPCNSTATGSLKERYFTDTFVAVIITLYVLVLLVGLPGNLLTCAVIILRKHMRRSIHFYTFNLAVADLFILLVYGPTQMIFLYNQARWLMGGVMCSLSNLVIPLNLNASIATLIAISFDRHRGLTQPFKWRAESLQNAKKIIPVIWFVSAGLVYPVFHFSKLESNVCWEQWPSARSELAYWTFIAIAQYILPFITIVTIHVRMIYVMSKGKMTIYSLHMRMVKMVIGLLTVYLVCNGMQHVMFYWNFFGNVVAKTSYGAYLFIVSNLCIIVQASVNPFIYGASRSDFKEAYTGLAKALSAKFQNFIFRGKKDGYSLSTEHVTLSDDSRLQRSMETTGTHVPEVALTPLLFHKSYSYSTRNGALAPPPTYDDAILQKRRVERKRLETLAYLDPEDLPVEAPRRKRSAIQMLGDAFLRLPLPGLGRTSHEQEMEISSPILTPNIIVTEFDSDVFEMHETTSPAVASAVLLSTPSIHVFSSRPGIPSSSSDLHNDDVFLPYHEKTFSDHTETWENNKSTHDLPNDIKFNFRKDIFPVHRRKLSDSGVTPKTKRKRDHSSPRADTLMYDTDSMEGSLTRSQTFPSGISLDDSEKFWLNAGNSDTNVVLLSYRQSQILEYLDKSAETNI